jgi:hypothetical protein
MSTGSAVINYVVFGTPMKYLRCLRKFVFLHQRVWKLSLYSFFLDFNSALYIIKITANK